MKAKETPQDIRTAAVEEAKQIAKEALTYAQKAKQAAVRTLWMETRIAKAGAASTKAGKQVSYIAGLIVEEAEKAVKEAAEAQAAYMNLADDDCWDYEPDEEGIKELLKIAKQGKIYAERQKQQTEYQENSARWWYTITEGLDPQGWHSEIETSICCIIKPTALDPEKI